MLFKRKEVLVLSIIFLFLMISAVSCPKQLSWGGKGEEEGIFTGTKGLTANFIPGMPPENVWKGVTFDIGVDVQNQGRLDVSNGGVCVKSFTTQTFGKGDQCSSLELIHGREEFLEGEVKQFIWNGFVIQEEDIPKDRMHPITAQVCYVGEVIATPDICIRSADPLIESRCEAKDISLSGGQGGPVAVTKVKQDIIPGETQNELLFNINVKNVGGGRVVDQRKIKVDCSGLDKISERGIVNVEVSLPGYETAECQNDGDLRLTSSGEGEILCKGIKVPSDVSFPLPLNIGLTFGYVSSFPGGFTVKKTAKGFD